MASPGSPASSSSIDRGAALAPAGSRTPLTSAAAATNSVLSAPPTGAPVRYVSPPKPATAGDTSYHKAGDEKVKREAAVSESMDALKPGLSADLLKIAGNFAPVSGGRILHQVRVTGDGGLETVGRYDFDGQLGCAMIAHPKLDPASGELFALSYDPYLKRPCLKYYFRRRDGTKSDVVEIPLDQPTMINDFAITENFVVVPEQKVVFKLGKMFPDGEKTTRFGVLPKYAGDASEMVWVDVPDCFCFRLRDAWEERESDEVVVIGSCMTPGDGRLERVFTEIRLNTRTGTSTRCAVLPPASQVKLEVGMVNRNKFAHCTQALSNDRYKSAHSEFLRLGGGGGNLSSTTAGSVPAASSNTVSSGGNSVPPAVTTDEDVSKLDLAFVAFTSAIAVPLHFHNGDLASSWGKGQKWLYLLFACLSLTLPVISLCTASPGPRGIRRFISSACARSGLLVASDLLIVFIVRQNESGWVAEVFPAASVVVILILAVLWNLWIWSAQAEPTSRAEAAAAEEAASLPHDVP